MKRRMLSRMQQLGTPVIVRWAIIADAVLDPTTGAQLGALTVASQTIRAFVHFVAPITSGIRQFAEVEAGDVIVDFPPGINLDGKKQLTFEIGGIVFVQKEAGEKLAAYWDTMFSGDKLCRTLLLRKQT